MKGRTFILGGAIVLGVLGAALLVAFGLTYTRPYVQVSEYKEGVCTVTSSEYFPEDLVHCECVDCNAKYPCSRVLVNITTSSGRIMKTNVTLYDKYETFQLQAHTKQCSYHSCHRSVETNKAAMFNFLSGVGNVGQRYTCYYSPADQTSAILSIVSVHTVIHCMLWPALAVVFGVVILLYYVASNGGSAEDANNGAKEYLESFRTRVGNKYDNFYRTVPQSESSGLSSPHIKEQYKEQQPNVNQYLTNASTKRKSAKLRSDVTHENKINDKLKELHTDGDEIIKPSSSGNAKTSNSDNNMQTVVQKIHASDHQTLALHEETDDQFIDSDEAITE